MHQNSLSETANWHDVCIGREECYIGIIKTGSRNMASDSKKRQSLYHGPSISHRRGFSPIRIVGDFGDPEVLSQPKPSTDLLRFVVAAQFHGRLKRGFAQITFTWLLPPLQASVCDYHLPYGWARSFPIESPNRLGHFLQ